MKLNKQHLLQILLAVLAVLSLTACSSGKTEDADTAWANGVFESMKTADLDGNSKDSSIFSEQKVTFVTVWTAGCSPCVEEIPVFDKLNKEFADKGASFKGLYYHTGETLSDEERESAKEIIESADAGYEQLTISEEMSKSATLANIQSFPTTFVVNSDGQILDSLLGVYGYDGWKELAEEYLAEIEDANK